MNTDPLFPIDHLIIRPIGPDDAQLLHRLVEQDRARLARYFPVTTARTTDPKATQAYVRDLLASAAARESMAFLIHIDGSSGPVGLLFLRSFDHQVRKCELAYFVSNVHAGKGIATAAVAWAVDEAFRGHGLQRIFLRIDPNNHASIRVAEKNGFEREGLLRRDFRTPDDELLDVIVFGKLSS